MRQNRKYKQLPNFDKIKIHLLYTEPCKINKIQISKRPWATALKRPKKEPHINSRYVLQYNWR